MTPQQFNYSISLKRMMNDIYLLEEDLTNAKSVGMQGVSHGALMNIESCIVDLKKSIDNAIKTVGT